MSSSVTSNDIDTHINKKYEIRRRLGKGAYGVVWKATDRLEHFWYSFWFLLCKCWCKSL